MKNKLNKNLKNARSLKEYFAISDLCFVKLILKIFTNFPNRINSDDYEKYLRLLNGIFQLLRSQFIYFLNIKLSVFWKM